MVSNSRTVNNIIGALLAIIITFLCFGSTYAVEPEKPWPEDLGDGDRLYASYLNGMFGVLYNWCQNKQIILDNLLNNGNGVASVTARLGKFDNLSVPELDNLLHNGTGIASLTANLLKALQEVEAPLYKVNGRADAPSVNTDDGYIYYDIDTQRLMGYQEGHWRDLSPLTIVGTDSLHSPLIIEGYLETTNSYVENKVVIGNASESHNEIGTVSAKIDFGNDGAIRIPVNSNPNQLNTEFGTGSIAYNPTTKKLLIYDGTSWISPVPEITVDNVISSTSTNPVQNKKVKEYVDQQDTSTLNSAKSYADTKDTTTLNSAKSYADSKDTATLNSAKTYADSKDTATLNSAKAYADSAAATVLNSANTMPTTKPTNPTKGTIYYDTASNTLRFYDGNVWKPVSNLSQNGGIDQSGTAQNTFRGESFFINDIIMVANTELVADNVELNSLKVDKFLKLPTSQVTSAPQGSIAYNAATQNIQYKSFDGWKDIISSVPSSELNIRVKNRTSPQRFFDYYTSESYNSTNNFMDTDNHGEKIVEIGDNIVVWIIHPGSEKTTTYAENYPAWAFVMITPPDEIKECRFCLSNLGTVKHNFIYDDSCPVRYQIDGVYGTAYESIEVVPDAWVIIQPYTSATGNTPSKILNIPYMYIVGFK